MPTNREADQIYEQALEGLNKVIRAGRATTEEQRDLAKEKRTDLTLNYIGQSITNVEERTAKFQTFIGEMQAVIGEFDSDTAVSGIVKLKEVVDEAIALVDKAQGT